MTAGSTQSVRTHLVRERFTFGLDLGQEWNQFCGQGSFIERLDHGPETFQSLNLDGEDSGLCKKDLGRQ